MRVTDATPGSSSAGATCHKSASAPSTEATHVARRSLISW